MYMLLVCLPLLASFFFPFHLSFKNIFLSICIGTMELVSTDSEDVMVTTNMDITLNTELVFRNKGSCGVRPRLTQVQLQLNSNEIKLNCQSEDQCEDDRVSYMALGNITITNAVSDDEGNYRFGAQVSCPSQIVQTKDFSVTITGKV